MGNPDNRVTAPSTHRTPRAWPGAGSHGTLTQSRAGPFQFALCAARADTNCDLSNPGIVSRGFDEPKSIARRLYIDDVTCAKPPTQYFLSKWIFDHCLDRTF